MEKVLLPSHKIKKFRFFYSHVWKPFEAPSTITTKYVSPLIPFLKNSNCSENLVLKPHYIGATMPIRQSVLSVMCKELKTHIAKANSSEKNLIVFCSLSNVSKKSHWSEGFCRRFHLS